MSIFLKDDSPHVLTPIQQIINQYRNGERGWRVVRPEELLAKPWVRIVEDDPQERSEELSNEIAEDLLRSMTRPDDLFGPPDIEAMLQEGRDRRE